MLPVWFLMFRYKGDSYTMLVNGQTGKTVGAVPAEKKKLWIMFGILVPFMSLLGIGLCALLKSWDAFSVVLYCGWLVWLMLFGIGWGIFQDVVWLICWLQYFICSPISMGTPEPVLMILPEDIHYALLRIRI